ncbi:hypothetical protein DKX38_026675 [Salix brachista]|uniref:Pentatricopeptide repeat-containing protein n=1 Tax=Salix brachista TaxID=2182728 RepID=A0A5N5JLU7_9ROSI|nr:hypothetical protein DKX38_026675 [Salix brachista]
MASGSLLLSLSRSKLGSLCALEKWKPVRFLSSGGASRSASEFLEEEELNSKENEDDLKGRIFRLRLPKRSVTNVIDKWVREGNAVSASELRHISKELRKSIDLCTIHGSYKLHLIMNVIGCDRAKYDHRRENY